MEGSCKAKELFAQYLISLNLKKILLSAGLRKFMSEFEEEVKTEDGRRRSRRRV